jgi:hypothetical protein
VVGRQDRPALPPAHADESGPAPFADDVDAALAAPDPNGGQAEDEMDDLLARLSKLHKR